MNIKVYFNNNEIRVEFENDLIPTKIYELGKSINLTELVKDISGINNYIQAEPINFQEFITSNTCTSKEHMKVVEYIYIVFEAYNQSYKEVCADKEE